MLENDGRTYISNILFWLYLIFLLSIICSFNVWSSIAIALILLSGFFKKNNHYTAFFSTVRVTTFITACFIFYLLQLLALIYTNNAEEGWKHLQLKSALLIIPLALISGNFLNQSVFKKLMKWFIILLLVATLYCLIIAFTRYLKSGDFSIFFYHQLLSPWKQHAIQFSILVFLALVHVLEIARKGSYFFNYLIHLVIIIYLIFFILLLSSKLVIAFLVLYLLYYFVTSLHRINRTRFKMHLSVLFGLGVILIILFTHNPVSKRFTEIVTGEIGLIKKTKFHPNTYFNGLQFRLLHLRFVKEILNEKNAWIKGVSPGDAQQLLDQKYTSTDMYVGDPRTGDRGFLGYNTHNQFLESLLQTGILGLLAFIAICYGMIRMAWEIRRAELSFLVILLLAYACNESVFETQYGLTIFLFFPLFLYQSYKQKSDDLFARRRNPVHRAQ